MTTTEALNGRSDRAANALPSRSAMSNAWETWKSRTRSSAMATPEGRDLMLKRHEIVVRIIDANSRRLRLENEINGLDIRRRLAERDLEATGAPKDTPLAEINSEILKLEGERNKIDAERAWLDGVLAEFDAPERAKQDRGTS